MKLLPELIQFVKEHEKENVHTLALQAKKYPEMDMELVVRQIAGRQIAKSKIPFWYSLDNIIYPKHLSLEQSSSEQTALYKASLYLGSSMVDLTGGMGVDFSFFASKFLQSTYVEQQPELVGIAAHNFDVLTLNNVNIICRDGLEYLRTMSKVDLIYIDPGRRDNAGRKTVRIEDCTPDILEIEDLLEEKADIAMIKLSPMLDISLALKSLKNISHVHIISVNNECKELLFIKDKTGDRTRFHCVNIQNSRTDIFTFYKDEEESVKTNYGLNLGKYLYEPNASILKAGAYKRIAEFFELDKLHISSHLYTSDILEEAFQGRIFLIFNTLTLSKTDIKTYFSNIKQANITTRNFPLSVQEIRKKTGIKEGGDIYIFATTLADEKKVLIVCKKI